MLGKVGVFSDFFFDNSGNRLTAIYGTSSPSSLEAASESSASLYNFFASSSSARACNLSASIRSASLIYLKISLLVFFLCYTILKVTTVMLATNNTARHVKMPTARVSAVPNELSSISFGFTDLEASTVACFFCYNNRYPRLLWQKIRRRVNLCSNRSLPQPPALTSSLPILKQF